MGNCLNDSCCNQHDNQNHEEKHKKIYLTLKDDSQLECDVIDIFNTNNQDYIAVLPINSDSALLYRFKETNEDVILSNIGSDEEYAMVSEVFLSNHNHEHHHSE